MAGKTATILLGVWWLFGAAVSAEQDPEQLFPELEEAEKAPAPPPLAPINTSLAEWLVEEGRTYALSTQAKGTPHDARIVLALMKAASRLAPELSEPYRWEYDLAGSLGDYGAAFDALGKYMATQDSDISRQLEFIGASVATYQTVEERGAFLNEFIKPNARTGQLVQSDVHRRLAELLYGQGDTQEADRHADFALRLYPNNESARLLKQSFHEPLPGDLAEALSWIGLLSADPCRWEDSVGLARRLDCFGLREEAENWYRHALALVERDGVDDAVAAELLAELSRSLKSANKLVESVEASRQAVARNPDSASGRVLHNEMCQLTAESAECTESKEWLNAYYEQKARRLENEPDGITGATLSWYYGQHGGDAERALAYAEQSLALLPDHPVVQSCAGYAYLLNDDASRAAELLAGPAEFDAQAAVGLARAKLAMGERDAAIGLLNEVIAGCASGRAYDEAIAELGLEGVDLPVLTEPALVTEALSRVSASAREVCFHAGRALLFRVTLTEPIEDPLESWEFRIRLANRGDFPVTLGPDMMIDPRVVLSFELEGEAGAQFPDYKAIYMDERPALSPRELYDKIVRVDTGPLREFLVRTVQANYEVRVRAVLNPVLSADGRWVPSPEGPSAYEFRFHRPGLVATANLLERLEQASTSEDPRARAKAAEQLTALWAERQANQPGPKRYAQEIISEEMMRAALRPRWTDANQEVRLRSLGALRLVNIEGRDIGPLAGLLPHQDPLTRMETVLLLADQQGAGFLPVVQRMAEQDPDPLVRQLCSGFVANWTSSGNGSP